MKYIGSGIQRFWHFHVVFHNKICVFIIFIPFFDEVSNSRKYRQTNIYVIMTSKIPVVRKIIVIKTSKNSHTVNIPTFASQWKAYGIVNITKDIRKNITYLK